MRLFNTKSSLKSALPVEKENYLKKISYTHNDICLYLFLLPNFIVLVKSIFDKTDQIRYYKPLNTETTETGTFNKTYINLI